MANESQRFGSFTVINRFEHPHVFSGYRDQDPHTLVVAKTHLQDSLRFQSEFHASRIIKVDQRNKDTRVVCMSDFEQIGGDHVACYFPYIRATNLYENFLSAEKQR